MGTYDAKSNARIVRPEDLDHFYWRMRTLRGLAIGIADSALAGLLWAASTNRLFVVPPTATERTETAIRTLEQARSKVAAVAIVRNVLVRDEGFRQRGDVYWRKEAQVMGEVMDERDVVEGVRNALSGRVSVAEVEEEARRYAERIVVGQNGTPGTSE